MTPEEKSQLIDLIKTDIKIVAKSEAQGEFQKAEELHKGLETKIEKALGDLVSKSDFDVMETSLKKQIADMTDGNKKELSFSGEIIKKLTDNKDLITAFTKGLNTGVQFDIIKVPGVFTGANSLGATTATTAFAVNNNSEIVPLARRNRHVRELLGMGQTDEAVYTFLRETAKDGSIGIQNPEGAAKAQIEYKATLATATESTIAAFQLIGRQTLRNVKGIATFINTMMVADLMLKEDGELFFGTGADGRVEGIFNAPVVSAAFAGIPSFKVPAAVQSTYDAIAGICALLANSEYQVNFVGIHPVDYWKLLSAKDTQGRHLQNIIFDAQTSMLYVYGVPVIATTAIPLGYIGAGDSRYVMPMAMEGMSLRFFDQDGTNVQQNLITARIEESILNVVRRPNAFFYDTIANVLTAITPA